MLNLFPRALNGALVAALVTVFAIGCGQTNGNAGEQIVEEDAADAADAALDAPDVDADTASQTDVQQQDTIAADAADVPDAPDVDDATAPLDAVDASDTVDVLDIAPDVADTTVDAGDVTPTCAKASDCDDNNLCTADSCFNGYCKFTDVTAVCAAGDPCVTPSCDAKAGCSTAPFTGPCDDGIPCTSDDTCATGACQGKPSDTLCNDDNGCTVDACDLASGCTYTAAVSPCSDGNACTVGDLCSGGTCLPGDVTVCDDGNLCTDDSCDAVNGCVFLPNTVTCDDDDLCTTDDVCGGSKCNGTEVVCPGPTPDAPCNYNYCNGYNGQCEYHDATYWYDFSRKGKFWTLEGEWQVGLAAASTGNTWGDADIGPPDWAGTWLAGTVVGGNISNTPHDWWYLTSPAIDLSGIPTDEYGVLNLGLFTNMQGSAGQLMKLEFSPDNGATWTDSATTNLDWIGGPFWWEVFVFPFVDQLPPTYFVKQFRARIGYKVEAVQDVVAPIVSGITMTTFSINRSICND